MVRERIEMAKKTGMEVRLNFIIGLPFDTLETMQETIDFAKSMPVESVGFSLATPLPGTKFYEIVEKKGRFLKDLNMNSISFSGKATYEIASLSAEEINAMYHSAYRQFYFRPSFIWRVLTKNRSLKMHLESVKSGLNILFQGEEIPQFKER
jgi:radical SAM superfamily enzyme YgiQ (UPF0313 family)